MSSELHHLEGSLKEFLSESQNEHHNSSNANLYKYNNLKISMEPSKYKVPHFIVRIGISEAVYNLASGERISGGLGSDERLIRRWADKSFIKSDLNIAWTQSKKIKIVSVRWDDED